MSVEFKGERVAAIHGGHGEVREVELLPGGSPYCATQADVDRLLTRTEQCLAAAAKAGWRPATVTQTANELEAEFTERGASAP